MKTKVEILKQYGWDGEVPFDENIKIYFPALLNAMDEYAEQSRQAAVSGSLPCEECKYKAGVFECGKCGNKSQLY